MLVKYNAEFWLQILILVAVLIVEEFFFAFLYILEKKLRKYLGNVKILFFNDDVFHQCVYVKRINKNLI